MALTLGSPGKPVSALPTADGPQALVALNWGAGVSQQPPVK